MASEYKARDLGALEKTVNDAAGKVMVLWTGFITVAAYLLIATGSVKHRDLFLDSTIKLPVLGVDLPVTGYFVFAPLILLIFHFYVLLQLAGLGQKVLAYNLVLNESFESADDRRMARRRLDDFPFLQFLAGVRERRRGVPGTLQIAISWITTALFPVMVFLQLQIAFLPYHSEPVTWLQRLCLVADIALVWFFWRTFMRASDRKRRKRFWRAAAAAGTIAIMVFSVFLATFPGEWLYRNFVAKTIDAVVSFVAFNPAISASRFFFEGDVDGVTGRPSSLFANRILVPGERFYDESKHEKAEVSVSLRGRDLRGAILQRADLRLADFTGASLLDASFVGAQLQKANFGCAAKLLLETSGRERQRIRADTCDEERATDLRGTDFSEAILHGTRLNHAKLHGARFARSMMQGVRADNADMTAATLMYARLEGASLVDAKLIGVSLFEAQMQGADLSNADLGNATLQSTQLQAARLDGADLTNATLRFANLYRAFFDAKDHSETTFLYVRSKSTFPRSRSYVGRPDVQLPKELDAAGYKVFLQRALEGIKNPDVRDAVSARLAALDPARTADKSQYVSDKPLKSEPAMLQQLREARGKALSELICDKDGAPYTARGLIFNGRVLGLNDPAADMNSDQAIRLIGILRGDACPGAAALDVNDLREVNRIERLVVQLKRQRQNKANDRNEDDDDDDDSKPAAPPNPATKK